MLTQRKIDIILHIANHPDWVTSDYLSNVLGFSKKTIQQDIKEILSEYGSFFSLEINKQKGYKISFLSNTMIEKIIEELNRIEGFFSLASRQSSIILFLIFSKDYLSMQDIADTFYLSKTQVSNEMKVILRWLNRYPGLSLEINKNFGVMIFGSEQRKRIYFSKHGTILAIENIPFDLSIKEPYLLLYPQMLEIIETECIKKNCLLVSYDIQKIARYLTISIIRSSQGFLESETLNYKKDLFIENITKNIFHKFKYELKPIEIQTLEILINESDKISLNKENIKIEIKDKIKQFSNDNYKLLSLSELEIEEISQIIEKIIRRKKLEI